ncbi:MAG: cytidine deaminase [Candidatus Eremiobacteraeota bacterium]|nr:cytidine deaminase [Candidatus Eremiobacteraeota bacterium]
MPRLDDAQLESLVSRAWEARLNAYAPYSQFHVGAALLTADGRVFTGANVENASLGLSMCAERVAIGAAAAAGARSVVAIAVAGVDDNGVFPCGGCRQVLSEFSPSMLIVRCRPDGTYSITSLEQLLSSPFTGESVEKGKKTQSESIPAGVS